MLVGVPADSAINREEIFGPVAPITTFETEDEAIARANDTEYGLASYVFTRDLARTIRLAEALDYGMVGVNTGLVSNAAAPFGGVKASGFGREGGFEGIEEYLETTYVALAAADPEVEPYAGVSAQYAEFAAHAAGESPCFVEWSRGVAADPEVLAWIDDAAGPEAAAQHRLRRRPLARRAGPGPVRRAARGAAR